jgi:hypothetical protein
MTDICNRQEFVKSTEKYILHQNKLKYCNLECYTKLSYRQKKLEHSIHSQLIKLLNVANESKY